MSYDISFKVKVEGVDAYVRVGGYGSNITWNVRDIITKSTGLKWHNEANNGRCKDVILSIAKGFHELMTNPDKYKRYEDKGGWGTVEDTKRFFYELLRDWDEFCHFYPELIEVTTFWIE